jgi:RNA polymerase sigma-70 factor (ECF subfamily)
MRLARAAADGDERATRAVLCAVEARVKSVVALTLGPAHPDCADVTQLALLAFVRSLPAFRGECEPVTYASRIALSAALLAARRTRLHNARFVELQESDEPAAVSTHDALLSEHRKRLLRELLRTIPQPQAEAFALRIVLGCSLEEIALASNAPVNTIRSRLRLAKEALRRRLQADHLLCDRLEVSI